MSITVETATEIRSFQIEFPQEQIDDLRRRVAATRWPTNELVADRSQGVQLATLPEVARYWTRDAGRRFLGTSPGGTQEPHRGSRPRDQRRDRRKIDMRLEVSAIPVSDGAQARQFDGSLGHGIAAAEGRSAW